eukprot:TRINITY_DN426_c0_g1_i3.p1 TRINITY_DN426_c0_g1~~TRINITY_DN426_c0_g1_i3.p1  ORF type:complete len:103 (+),score=9.38 TRINITY_DN426_c0_g1_i3:34-309(+)
MYTAFNHHVHPPFNHHVHCIQPSCTHCIQPSCTLHSTIMYTAFNHHVHPAFNHHVHTVFIAVFIDLLLPLLCSSTTTLRFTITALVRCLQH